MNARARALADDEIDSVILHGRIKNLLDRGEQAMDFIEEEKLADLDRRENRREVALALEQRAGTGLDRNAQFIGDNLRKRSLTKTWRAIEQHVIERIAAAAGGFDGDQDIFLDARLADEVRHALWANAGIQPRVFIEGAAGNHAFGCIGHFLGREKRRDDFFNAAKLILWVDVRGEALFPLDFFMR